MRHRLVNPRAVRLLGAILAIIGQVAFVAAASAEGWRGPDAKTHIEQHGTQLHYAHNEATCPGCIVQSLHARAEPPASPLPQGRGAVVATVTRLGVAPFVSENSSNGTRAPPRAS
jgi:hypothetical protein